MAILVTGACGFVGLNIVERLLAAGRAVGGLDRLPLPARAAQAFARLPGRLTLIDGAVLVPADLDRALAPPIDAVIHCAVITAGADREKSDPQGIVAVNVQGAVATLMAAARHGVPAFIYPSSISVYGRAAASGAVITEDGMGTDPITLYAMTKLASETMLTRLAALNGIRFAAARLASVYGPWEYATGVRDTLSPMVQAMDLARTGVTAVLSASSVGDFVYARDVAAGLIALADTPNFPRALYNLGSGRVTSAPAFCTELATRVPGFSWRMAQPEETPNVITYVDFDRGPMDVSRIARDIGFTPRFDIETAIADWLRPL